MTPFPPPPDPEHPPDPDEEIRTLLEGNRRWVEARERDDPETFPLLARRHAPPFFFLGCCDARKPMDLLTGASPGHLFIHRNVANQVRPDDPAIQASLEFALEGLRVRHLIVTGHSACGGVKAALAPGSFPAVDRWVRPVREFSRELTEELEALDSPGERADHLARRSVVRQVEHALSLEPVQAALRDPDRIFRVHGWFFRLETGRIETLELPMDRWRAEGLWPDQG